MIIKAADHPVVDGIAAGQRRVVGVFAVPAALGGFCAAAEGVVHGAQKVPVDQIVRIKNAESVVRVPLLFKIIESEGEGVAFALDGGGAGENPCACTAGCFGGVIGAVVGDHIDVEELFWIVLGKKAFHQAADDGFFVPGGDEDGKALLRGKVFHRLVPSGKRGGQGLRYKWRR